MRAPRAAHAVLGRGIGPGLTLVTLLADAWGAEERKAGVGKAVWFELGLTH
ncbi:hypothetical protein ACIRJS_18890 [Streptomyces sp. NPDC102340]|uniref:hypothetical protein n=1 Tax=unclassified Streptomyces TaxID=2593676 RepID=UPI0038024AF4